MDAFACDAMRDFAARDANWRGLSRVSVTFDIDWAPDYMVAHVLDILDAADVRATFFVTHDSPLVRRMVADGRHEIGWHPNLTPGSTQGDGLQAVSGFLSAITGPVAGSRFHLLSYSYRDLAALAAAGVRYDVSTFLFNASHLLPCHHPDLGLTRIPYCWEDGLCENAGLPMRVASMGLGTPGVKIVNFHPMNVWVNGASAARRREFRAAAPSILDCPRDLAERHRHQDEEGAEAALRELLAEVPARGGQFQTVGALHRAFAQASAAD